MQIKHVFYFFLISLAMFQKTLATISIMLDPAGDAKHTGRQIEDSLERGITLQFTEKLKNILENLYPNIRIILTRFPGETIYPLQNANFANRLDVDFYISIHFYAENETKPNIFMYYFSYGDEFVTKITDLCFYQYDNAHRINGSITRKYAHEITTVLTNDENIKLFNFHGPYGIPFKPLIGIKAPSIAIEIGLKEKNMWQNYIQPIAESIKKIVDRCEKI